jgi:5-methylthioadenosine/S-adenosylhomocysteine deaminase
MTRTMIHSVTAVTVDAETGTVYDAVIVFEGDKLVSVGKAGRNPPPCDVVIDGTGLIAVPGLINAHTHLWQTALRGLGADWAGMDYFKYVHATFGPAFEPEDSRSSELLGALGQLNGGTTTVFDWCHNNRTPEHSDASLEGLARSGIRTIFGHGTVKAPSPQGRTHYSQTPHPRAEIERLRRQFPDDDGLVSIAMCILGPDYSTLEVTRKDLQVARELDIRSSAHVWGKPNRLVPNGYRGLTAEGLVTAKHNVVHGNYMLDDELRKLIDAGASITSTPPGEIMGTAREPLVRRIRRLGGTPSIGNDTELGMTGEMFEVARRTLALYRLFDNLEIASSTSGRPRTDLQTYEARTMAAVGHDGGALQETYQALAADALRWATLDNARALGIDHLVGSLTPGKKADIVLVDATSPALAPAHDPVDAVVSSGHSGVVDTVIVNGIIRKRAGKLVDQPQLARATEDARAAGEGILRRTGYPAPGRTTS